MWSHNVIRSWSALLASPEVIAETFRLSLRCTWMHAPPRWRDWVPFLSFVGSPWHSFLEVPGRLFSLCIWSRRTLDVLLVHLVRLVRRTCTVTRWYWQHEVSHCHTTLKLFNIGIQRLPCNHRCFKWAGKELTQSNEGLPICPKKLGLRNFLEPGAGGWEYRANNLSIHFHIT